MDEKETKEETGKEETKDDKDTGDKPEETKEPEQEDAVAKRMAELESKVARLELGGGSEAGQAPAKPKELTPEEYAESFQRGEQKNPLK